MSNSLLYRVLEVDDASVVLNPIEGRKSSYHDTDQSVVRVGTNTLSSDIAQVVNVLQPGHLVDATLTASGGTHRFKTLRHKGGLSLVELDSRSTPYLVEQYLDQSGSYPYPPNARAASTTILSDPPNPVQDEHPTGELTVYWEHSESPSWAEFQDGTRSEYVYGSFDTLDGSPSEVLVGNPDGAAYWYALAFVDERTELARAVRAQFGYLYDDEYRSNPAWNTSQLVDYDAVPADPDADPTGLLRSDYSIHSSHLPSRFGPATIDLITEFVWVGQQFDSMFSSGHSKLNPDAPLKYTVADVRAADQSVERTYRCYVRLLQAIYERANEHPETSLDTLVKRGDLPPADVLRQLRIRYRSQLHQIEAYLTKMDSVPLERYLIGELTDGLRDEVNELPDDVDTSGFPGAVRRVLYDIEQQLDQLTEVLQVDRYVVDATSETDSNGLTVSYEAPLNEEAYEFVATHQEKVKKMMKAAEMGGTDPGVFQQLLGRLGRRHQWLDTSSLEGLGGVLADLESYFEDSPN